MVLEADGNGPQGNPRPPLLAQTGLPIYDGTDFVFDFEVIPVPGTYEPNDWLNLAFDTGIRGDGTFDTTGTSPRPAIGDGMWPTSDIDFYSFVLHEPSIVEAHVTAANSSDLDPLMRLFDSSGNELLVIDDTLGLEGSANVALRDPGTYYVAVSAFGNSDHDPHQPPGLTHTLTSGAYDLMLHVTGDPVEARSVSGYVRHELAHNEPDPSTTPPLVGWTVYVDVNQNGTLDSADQATQTMSDGRYAFDGLAPQEYDILINPRPGWQITTPPRVTVNLGSITAARVDFARASTRLSWMASRSPMHRIGSAIGRFLIGAPRAPSRCVKRFNWPRATPS